MRGPWCLIVSHLQKSSFKLVESCVTLGPKREPLQLLACEGVDHAGHLVLPLMWVVPSYAIAVEYFYGNRSPLLSGDVKMTRTP